MNTRVRVLLFTLGLPVIAFGLAWASMAKIDSVVREQLHRQYPDVPAEKLSKVTVPALAARGAFKTTDLPETYAHLQLARSTALATGLVGLLLIGGVSFAGYVTRDRRDLLLRLFKPGLYVTLIAVGLLTAAQAFAAAYALYYFESIFVERVHFVLIIGIAIGGALAFLAVVRAMLSLLKAVDFRVLGRPVAESEQPALWAMVKDICRELNTAAPDNLILGIEPSFYVTESDITYEGGQARGRSLFLSLSLSRVLTVPELRAIVGHEMAHFIGEDTVFSQRFFPVYRGTFTALANLSRNAVHGAVAVAQLPAITILGFFYQSFAASEKNLCRQRETAADAVGARIGGGSCLATALVKVHAYHEVWGQVLAGVKFNEEEFRSEPNLARAFATRAAGLPVEAFSKAGERIVAHPIDSHPPLVARLLALHCELPATIAITAVPAAEDSAAALIAGHDALEEKQTESARRMLRPA
jgi:Zn-dependent protease with chaperone function